MAKVTLELIAQTERWDGGIKKAQSALHNFIGEQGGLRQALANGNSTMAQAIAKFGEMGSKAATASSRLGEMEKMYMELGMTMKQMTAQERATPAGQATIRSLEQLRSRIIETRTQMQSLSQSIAVSSGRSGMGFGSAFMSYLVPGFGMGVSAMAAMEAAKAVRAFKDVVVDTVNVNMEFEQSNANLAAILGKKTIVEVRKLTENAKLLGATTVYTAGQISELQTVLARRGLNEQQILQMTHGISNLAVATGTDLAQSAELAASTMQAFGMKAGEMERIVSVLGVSTTKSALTTEALGTSLQYVAPAARAAGFSLEDTVAILGTLVNNGINASTAGTSLRQIMLSMSTSSGKLAKALGGPVKSFDELVVALQRLKNEGGNSLEAVSKSVRVTALPAFLALVNSADGLNSLRESITGVEGELQQMADTQINTLNGSTILLKSAWDGLKLSFSESNGIIKETVDMLTKLITQVTNARKLAQGGEGAISVLAKGVNQDEYNRRVGIYGGMTYDDVKSAEMILTQDVRTELEGMKELQKRYDAAKAGYKGGYDRFYGKKMAALDEEARQYGVNSLSALVKKIAEYSDIIATSEAIINHFDTSTLSMEGVAGDETSGNDIIEELKKLNKKKTPAEIAAESVANAKQRRDETMAKLAIEDSAGLMGSGELYRKMLNAEESYMDALASAAATVGGDYKKAFDEQVKVVESLSSELAGHTELQKKAKERLAEEERVAKEAKAEALRLDSSLYSGINSAVGRTAWQRISELDNGSLKGRLLQMKGVEVPDDVWEQFVADLNEKLAELKLPAIKLDLEAGAVTKMADEVKDMSTQWGYVTSAIGSVGQALQSIEDPSAKITGIVATAVASTALGFAQAATADSKYGTLAWIAAAAAGLANMTSMIASIKSATAEYHADGGFVGGGPKGTDTVNTWLTPGELVLNRAQQNNLAMQLAPAGGYGGGDAQPYVNGEQIWLGLSNYLKRTGRGEIVTSR